MMSPFHQFLQSLLLEFTDSQEFKAGRDLVRSSTPLFGAGKTAEVK